MSTAITLAKLLLKLSLWRRESTIVASAKTSEIMEPSGEKRSAEKSIESSGKDALSTTSFRLSLLPKRFYATHEALMSRQKALIPSIGIN